MNHESYIDVVVYPNGGDITNARPPLIISVININIILIHIPAAPNGRIGWRGFDVRRGRTLGLHHAG